jgi:hypothetical protein
MEVVGFLMPEGLFHAMLKINAIRQVPEGMCNHCVGAGQGEEIADLGDLWHELPVKACKACGGSGMATAKTEITGRGWMLAVGMFAAIWAAPPIVRAPLILLAASIAIFTASFLRRQTREETAAAEGRQAPIPSAPLGGAPEPETERVLSLNAAIESHRQTADQMEAEPARGSRLT